MAIKREKPSKAELQEFDAFIVECVNGNVVFPPTQLGGSGATIQELRHNRTVESLAKQTDSLETQGGKVTRLDKINTVQEKMIAGSRMTYSAAVRGLELLIKIKLYDEEKSRIEKRKREIKAELDELKTPKEKRAELERELAGL